MTNKVISSKFIRKDKPAPEAKANIEHETVGEMLAKANVRGPRQPKEREINKIGYVGPIVSKRRLRTLLRDMSGEGARTFREWFSRELYVPKHRPAVAKTKKESAAA